MVVQSVVQFGGRGFKLLPNLIFECVKGCVPDRFGGDCGKLFHQNGSPVHPELAVGNVFVSGDCDRDDRHAEILCDAEEGSVKLVDLPAARTGSLRIDENRGFFFYQKFAAELK